MLCDECKRGMRRVKTTIQSPYRFEECGLDNVYLAGIELHQCAACVVICPMIPRIQELHGVIAEVLINKPTRLVGQEIRYLRRWIGMEAQELAEILGVSAAHQSRVEHDKEKLGTASERLVRVCAMSNLKSLKLQEMAENLRRLERRKGSIAKAQKRLFEMKQTTWQAAAA